MKVSIIIPAYNCEAYISRTLDSVVNQSYSNWECLVIDDCSQDNGANIIQKYQQLDIRIKYLRTENNMGAFGARNVGIENAIGDYICFLDADDIWHKDKVKYQLDFMKEHDCDVSTHGYNYIDENDNEIKSAVVPLADFTLKIYMGNTCINMDTVMLDVSRMGKRYFINEPKREDTRYWIDILGQNYVIKGMDNVLASYRIHKGQISGNKVEMVLRTLNLYMKQPYINKWTAMLCFVKYVINAIIKRI